MTFGDTYDAVYKCLYDNLIGGLYVFESDGGAIGVLGPRDNDSETRPVYLLTLQEAKVGVVGD